MDTGRDRICNNLEYPSCVLKGDNSSGEFYSIAITNNMQQADTGTKMIHLGKNTNSRIVSKGISAGKAQNTYRGLVQIGGRSQNSRTVSYTHLTLPTTDRV